MVHLPNLVADVLFVVSLSTLGTLVWAGLVLLCVVGERLCRVEFLVWSSRPSIENSDIACLDDCIGTLSPCGDLYLGHSLVGVGGFSLPVPLVAPWQAISTAMLDSQWCVDVVVSLASAACVVFHGLCVAIIAVHQTDRSALSGTMDCTLSPAGRGGPGVEFLGRANGSSSTLRDLFPVARTVS